MQKNLHTGFKTGKLYNVHSTNVVCRRSIPTECYECGAMMYQKETDELHAYDVITYECRNNHIRTIYIEKDAK